jgi:hypothetical protein
MALSRSQSAYCRRDIIGETDRVRADGSLFFCGRPRALRCVFTRLTWRGDRWSRLVSASSGAVGIIAHLYIIAKHERFHPNAPINHKTKPNKLQVRITGTKSFSDAAHDTAEVVRLSDHAIIPSLA